MPAAAPSQGPFLRGRRGLTLAAPVPRRLGGRGSRWGSGGPGRSGNSSGSPNGGGGGGVELGSTAGLLASELVLGTSSWVSCAALRAEYQCPHFTDVAAKA